MRTSDWLADLASTSLLTSTPADQRRQASPRRDPHATDGRISSMEKSHIVLPLVVITLVGVAGPTYR
jgi:hypothetical protein